MEQALDFASIVMGIAASSQVVSLNRLLRARSVVRWDWLALAVALLVSLTLVQVWWGLARTTSGSIPIGRFLPDLVTLILLALLAFASLPDEVPAEGVDLKRYYHEQSGYIWSLFTLTFAWATAVDAVLEVNKGQALAFFLVDRAGDLLFLVLTATLIRVRRRWWHAAVLALCSLPILNWLSRSLG